MRVKVEVFVEMMSFGWAMMVRRGYGVSFVVWR